MARLRDNGVACCDCRNNRAYHEQKRVVPWGKYQRASLGFVLEVALGGGEEENPFAPFLFHPFVKVVDGFINFFNRGENFAIPSFEFRLMEIFPDGIIELLFTLDDCLAQFLELLNALLGCGFG